MRVRLDLCVCLKQLSHRDFEAWHFRFREGGSQKRGVLGGSQKRGGGTVSRYVAMVRTLTDVLNVGKSITILCT